MKRLLEKYNRIILLNLFIVTLLGGSFMFEHKVANVTFYAFRDLLVIGLLFFLVRGELKLYSNNVTKYTFYFLLIWLSYAIVSLSWVIDQTEGYKDIMYLLWGIATLIFLNSLKNGIENFKTVFTQAWSYVFIVIITISVWEIYAATHLVSNFTNTLNEIGPFHRLNFTPVFTFDNPNHYAFYACLSIVLFLGELMKKKHVALYSFFIACCVFLIHVLSARFGIITIIAYTIFLSSYYFRNHKNELTKPIFKGAIKLTLIFSFFVVGIFVRNDLHVQKDIIEDQGIEAIEGKSTFVRKNLILNGIDFLIDSKGKGVGAGNYKKYTQQGKGKYDVGTVDTPHNWPIEIASQYGVFILILSIWWGAYILKVIKSSVNKESINQQHLFILLLLSCYIIMSNANSSFMPLPLNWVLFSLIALFTDDLIEKKGTNV